MFGQTQNECRPPNQALDITGHKMAHTFCPTIFLPELILEGMLFGMKASVRRGSCLYTSASPQLPEATPMPPKLSQSAPRSLKFTGPKTLSALPLFRPSPPRPPRPKLPKLRLPRLPRLAKFIDDEKGTPWAWQSTAAQRSHHLLGATISFEFQVVFALKKIWKIICGDSGTAFGRTGRTYVGTIHFGGCQDRICLAPLRCFDIGAPTPSESNQMFRHVLSAVHSSI